MWGIEEDKMDEKWAFFASQHTPQLNLLHVLMQPCMALLKNFWHLNFGFYWWCLFNNEYFWGVKYMSNNWHFLIVGSCVTTMNINNVGSCVNNIHFMMWNAWETADIFLMVGSCVTTMNVNNVGSCVNSIHFVIFFLDA